MPESPEIIIEIADEGNDGDHLGATDYSVVEALAEGQYCWLSLVGGPREAMRCLSSDKTRRSAIPRMRHGLRRPSFIRFRAQAPPTDDVSSDHDGPDKTLAASLDEIGRPSDRSFHRTSNGPGKQ